MTRFVAPVVVSTAWTDTRYVSGVGAPVTESTALPPVEAPAAIVPLIRPVDGSIERPGGSSDRVPGGVFGRIEYVRLSPFGSRATICSRTDSPSMLNWFPGVET